MNFDKAFFLTGRTAGTALAFFLAAFLMRVVNLGALTSFTGDEAMHVASATNYTERGYFGPDNWYHPPLKHILLYGSMKLFGNNPYGWRMRNVLFGAATVPLLFILAFRLFGQTAAIISAVLLLLDPLHILFSRTTFEDIPAVFFLTATLLFFFKAIREGRELDWAFAGTLFGLSIALRLYCANILLLVLPFALARSRREGASGIVRMASHLIILPFTVYLAAFYPWFHRGYSVPEWVAMQFDALRELRTVSSFHPILTELAGPGKWFVRQFAIGFELEKGDGWNAYAVIMNDLPVWLLMAPSVLWLLVTGLRERQPSSVLTALFFWALYLPFLFVSRPIFLYSALPLLPFGFMAAGWAAERLLKERAYLFLAVAAAWCLLLYPLVVGLPVLRDLYGPLLGQARIFTPR